MFKLLFIFFILIINFANSASYYSAATTPYKHIITMNIKINDNNISIDNRICFKCYKNKAKTDLVKRFKKIKCSNSKYDGYVFTAFCRATLIQSGSIYEKDVRGNLEKANIYGSNQAEMDPVFGIGETTFVFLSEEEFLLYKKYLENNFFITTEDFKEMLNKKSKNN